MMKWYVILVGFSMMLSIETKRAEECELMRDAGPCRAYFSSFYFNSMTNQCETFIYGGCGGNKNRFQTKEECLNRCVFNNHDEP